MGRASDKQLVEGMVSTVIPVRNRAELVSEAIESVLGQSYRPIEIIVVDDGSTDSTSAVLDEWASKHPEQIQVVHQDCQGPGVARETGRRLARGEFIQYLDSDDVLMPRKFEWQVSALQTNLECGVAYGKTRCYHRGIGPRDVAWKRTGERIDTMFPAFLQSRWWGTSSPLYRRVVLDEAGPWVGLWNEEDWEYDCRIAAQGTKLYFCDEFVSDQRWDDRPRLSTAGTTDPSKLAHRAEAHRLIYGHARHYGIGLDTPEMRYFARELFLLARQCGSAGLPDQSRMLFNLAREASGPDRGQKLDFQLYRLAIGILGWRLAGTIACRMDRFRSMRSAG